MKSNNRIFKGKSLIEFPSDYTVVDIETNGNFETGISLLEVSAIKYRNNIKTDEFSYLIKQSIPIDYFIKMLTGITDKMVYQNGRYIEEVLSEFYTFVGNDILLGYNVNFDINNLYDNLEYILNLHLSNDFVDVLRIARKTLPSLTHHKQTDVAEYYKISTKGSHRALNDCEICNACYQNLKKDIIKKYGDLEKFKNTFKQKANL